MNLLITGKPGVGKTTLIKELCQNIKGKACGFYTEELRKGNNRVGFKIKTLSGETGLLASVDMNTQYRVGKYRINLEDFENLALPQIRCEKSENRIIIIDEIGPMELFSAKFRKKILAAFDSPNPVVATIKLKASKFIEDIKSRPDVLIYVLTRDNKAKVLEKIRNQLALE